MEEGPFKGRPRGVQTYTTEQDWKGYRLPLTYAERESVEKQEEPMPDRILTEQDVCVCGNTIEPQGSDYPGDCAKCGKIS